MTNVRAAAIAYFVFAVLVGLFLEHLLRLLWGWTGWADPQLLSENWTLTTLIGFVIAFGGAIAIWMRNREASLEIVQELRKVSWPTMDETKVSTIAVVVTTLVVAVVLGLFDFAWAEVTKLIYEAPRFIGS